MPVSVGFVIVGMAFVVIPGWTVVGHVLLIAGSLIALPETKGMGLRQLANRFGILAAAGVVGYFVSPVAGLYFVIYGGVPLLVRWMRLFARNNR